MSADEVLGLELIDIGILIVVQLLLIMVCACGGKLIGASVAARASGIGWRDSGAIAVLLNTRGLIELVVLNVGLSSGILISASSPAWSSWRSPRPS